MWSVLGSAALLVLGAGEAGAGWVIDQVVKGGDPMRQQVVIQANRMKTIVLDDQGAPTAAFVVDLDAETITQVDHRQRTYVSAPVREYVQSMTVLQQSANRQVQEALKKLEATLQNMPPEQRKQMEAMMRSRMATPPPGGGQECRERTVELRRTGETATIAGFPAVRHDVLSDGRVDAQVWVASGLTAWRELDPQKLQRFAGEMAKLAACGAPGRGLAGDTAWRVVTEGYPVRTVDPGGATVEVVKAESRSVAAAEFQPPAGFTRRTLAETTGR
jgi:hypothetical protein